MLSDVMNRHPQVLSLSELFSFIGLRAFARDRLDGEAMWKLLSRSGPGLQAMLNRDKRIGEIIYPFESPQARFSPQDVPAISVTTLPHLTQDCDSLYDELEPVIRARPTVPVADQYRFLFGWLCDRFGRELWIERSGGSLLFGHRLLQLFPEARVVHIYRDGRDTALSMHRHHAFTMMLVTVRRMQRWGMNPFKSDAIDLTAPPRPSSVRRFAMFLIAHFTNFDKMIDQEFDLDAYGELWSRMILFGQAYLSSLPPDRLFSVSYEEILERPREKLTELLAFIEPDLSNQAWLDEAVAIPRPNPPKYPSLPPQARLRLSRACAPGLKALGYAL